MKETINQIKLLIQEIILRYVYKIIYYNEFTIDTKFNKKAKTYIKIERCFNFKTGIHFFVSVPNMSYSHKKLMTAILTMFANESIGMAKYNICKELLEIKKIKNFHY